MSENSNEPNKKVYTDAERLKLAEKLDKDLDDFIDSLDKKSYTEGWPEDRWQEEMEKHPFFMTKTPESSAEMSPLMEGLQQLKYSEEYNSPEELAQSYKEDGNFNYKHKKYRLAVLSYSKGISSKCENTELLSQLYNNRSLAQFKLQNYRSSLNDCKQALKLKPDYLKTLLTAAKCCFSIKDYDKCVEYCEQILSIPGSEKEIDEDINNLKRDALKNKKIQLRDSRLRNLKEKKSDEQKEKVIEAIRSRTIKVDNFEKLFGDSQCRVQLNEENVLLWPVILAYPENNQTDFIQNFNECTLISEQLVEIFQEPPAWDCNRRYQVDNLNVYFIGNDKKPHKIDKNQPLGAILQHKKFVVIGDKICLFVLVANTEAEENFLKAYN